MVKLIFFDVVVYMHRMIYIGDIYLHMIYHIHIIYI